MGINIAAMDAGEKLAFAQAVGSVVLADGAISAPQLYIDAIFPTGYRQFELRLDSLKCDFNNPFNNKLGAVFSSDGGVTFFNNTVTNGTYKHIGQTIDELSSAVTYAAEGPLAMIGLINLRDTGETLNGVLKIMPGSDVKNPSIKFSGWTDFAEGDDGDGGHTFQMLSLESVAIAPNEHTGEVNTFHAMGRQNLIRLVWKGDNGDANPDPSQSSFSAGSWKLIGYP